VLVYHRIAPRDTPRYEIVSTIPHDLFRAQLNAFGEVGRIVPLQAQLSDPVDDHEELRFALTFDDDYASHAQHVLPILSGLGLHGTFFLSGRALHGLGGYWFQRLESLVAERGLPATIELLDLPEVAEAQLPHRCEGDAHRLALIDRHAPPGDAPIDATGIRNLKNAGMTVGFHTLHHPRLPDLDDDGVREALTAGRDRLAALVGRPLSLFAYPHGKTDQRTVKLTHEASYSAAWTTDPGVVRATDDLFRLRRWEPQPVGIDDQLILLGKLLRRVAR
jgi:peptidoglycan/xylan/chitin deacetylase (PgdA/CDA1 family)